MRSDVDVGPPRSLSRGDVFCVVVRRVLHPRMMQSWMRNASVDRARAVALCFPWRTLWKLDVELLHLLLLLLLRARLAASMRASKRALHVSLEKETG